MGYQYDDEDDEDFEFDGQGENNSQAPAELRKAYKALQRKYSKLETDFNTLKTDSSKTALSEVLKDRGLRPGLARHMLRDSVDPADKKAVDEWLEENAEDFGIDLSNDPGKEDGAPDERASNFARLQGAQANALPADTKMQELQRRMEAIKTDDPAIAAEEINRLLAEAGPSL